MALGQRRRTKLGDGQRGQAASGLPGGSQPGPPGQGRGRREGVRRRLPQGRAGRCSRRDQGAGLHHARHLHLRERAAERHRRRRAAVRHVDLLLRRCFGPDHPDQAPRTSALRRTSRPARSPGRASSPSTRGRPDERHRRAEGPPAPWRGRRQRAVPRRAHGRDDDHRPRARHLRQLLRQRGQAHDGVEQLAGRDRSGRPRARRDRHRGPRRRRQPHVLDVHGSGRGPRHDDHAHASPHGRTRT